MADDLIALAEINRNLAILVENAGKRLLEIKVAIEHIRENTANLSIGGNNDLRALALEMAVESVSDLGDGEAVLERATNYYNWLLNIKETTLEDDDIQF